MSDRLDFRQFVAYLKNQVRLKATTSLFMVTDDHHSIWIALRSGVIESLFYGPKKGVEALSHISRISGGKLKQNPKLNFPDTPGLPPTDVIIRNLEQGLSDSGGGGVAATAFMNDPEDAADASLPISPARLEQIITNLQKLLQQYLGPISGIVINRLQKRYGEIGTEAKLHRFIDELAKEVEGIGDHKAFRTKAKRLVGGYRK